MRLTGLSNQSLAIGSNGSSHLPANFLTAPVNTKRVLNMNHCIANSSSNIARILVALATVVCCLWLCCGSVAAQDQDESHQQQTPKPSKPVLVHYMPWFGSRSVSGSWGWHWTMGKLDPDKVVDDRAEIASHYQPSLGPYDSSDPDLIQCHLALMKISGIDGVVIDWYGIEDHFDYATNHRNTCLMIEAVKKAKMKFAICYEDQTIPHLVAAKKVKAGQEAAHGEKVLQWMERNWFSNDSYLKLDGKPALLVVGPTDFKKQQWEAITAGLKTKPTIFGLPHLSQHTGGNAFGWPPVSGGKETTRQDWTKYLDDLDRRADEGRSTVAPVFAQFHDYYSQAEHQKSHGSLAANDGDTFDVTLSRAIQSKAKFVQIATWNDFGEGTMIEPTREFGFSFLEKIQNQLKPMSSNGKPLKPKDLRLPVSAYLAQKLAEKKLKSRPDLLAKLDSQFSRVSQLLVQRNCERARIELDEAAIAFLVLTRQQADEKRWNERRKSIREYGNENK